MDKTDLRIRKTLRSIDTALLENLNQYAFHKITVEMICSSAMINKTTFYKYYTDKYDLLNKFIEKNLAEFKEALDSTDFILATTDTIDDPIYSSNFRKSAEAIYAKRLVYQTLWKAKFDRNIYDEMAAILKDNLLMTLLSSPCPNSEAVLYRQLYAGMFSANVMELFSWWFAHETEITVDDVCKMMTSNFKHGLFATFKNYCS
ncbi:MAG: TetR/AcrR family transcriptional regulator [Lachnospiraceae bacterium]|nr:TetR/AcrR family transcriptional regulator [Lachnospiraceae bacterium]